MFDLRHWSWRLVFMDLSKAQFIYPKIFPMTIARSPKEDELDSFSFERDITGNIRLFKCLFLSFLLYFLSSHFLFFQLPITLDLNARLTFDPSFGRARCFPRGSCPVCQLDARRWWPLVTSAASSSSLDEPGGTADDSQHFESSFQRCLLPL